MAAKPKEAFLLAVLLAAGACATPLGGFGSFLGSSDSETSTANPPSASGGGFVGSVLGALGSVARRPQAPKPPQDTGAPATAARRQPPAPSSPKPSPTTTTAPPPARATSTTTAATPSPSTTVAAPSASSTTAAVSPGPGNADEAEAVRSGANSSTPRPASSPQQEICIQNWHDVGNETVNNKIDVLSILLDYGGIPGQTAGKKWERNTTSALDPNKKDPDRWTYFYGDTDYKSFVRVERGSVHLKETPGEGTIPEEVRGDIWWEPKDFCGKLRHAKYYLWSLHCANPTAIETCKVLPVIDDRDFYTLVTDGKLIRLCVGEACDYSDDNRIPISLATSLVIG